MNIPEKSLNIALDCMIDTIRDNDEKIAKINFELYGDESNAAVVSCEEEREKLIRKRETLWSQTYEISSAIKDFSPLT